MLMSEKGGEHPRLLVLGGSRLQLPGIRRAQELGFRVGAVDRLSTAVGASVADDFFQVSTTDENGVAKTAAAYRPDGIITLGTDMPMRALAYAAAELGLVAPSLASVTNATDKGRMAHLFAMHDIPAPRSAVVASLDELQRTAAEMPLPLVIKPVDSSGSRGVTLVDHHEELEPAFRNSLRFSRSARAIAQEYVQGREVSVEGLCVDREFVAIAVTDKITTGPPNFVEVGHSQPTRLPSSQKAEIVSMVSAAVSALDLQSCAVHAELMVTEQGPRLIELGARLGGDFITSHLVPLSTGVDIVGALIRVACGQEPDTTPQFTKGSAVRFFHHPWPHGAPDHLCISRARSLDGVVQLSAVPGPGHRVESSLDRRGEVIAVSSSPEDALAICTEAIRVARGEVQ